jgi:hypothetical protein
MQAKMSHVTVSTERRKEQRKRPLGLVYVELSSANGGMLRDLSERGFAMRAMMPLRVGEATPFSFSLDPETRLEGHGKVLWVEEDGRVAGFQFTEISAETPEKIRRWLAEHSFGAPTKSLAAPPVKSEASTLQELREELRTVTPGVHDVKPAKAMPSAPITAPVAAALPAPVPVPEQAKVAAEVEVIPVAVLAEPEADAVFTKMELPRAEEDTDAAAVTEAEPETVPAAMLNLLPSLPELEVPGEPEKINRWMSSYIISLAIRMMLFLALVACGFVFHRPLGTAIVWLGMKIAGPAPTGISPLPASEETSPQVTPVAPNPAATNAEGMAPSVSGSEAKTKESPTTPANKSVEVPAVTENTSVAPAKNAPTSALVPLPATSRTTTFSASPSVAGEQLGQQEYLAAQDVLKNKNSGAGVPEAVRLLWIAVEKGNSNAEVTLAELYRQGQGVAKSCDQTKILLTAAARKGNAEAQKRLEQFQQEGCE